MHKLFSAIAVLLVAAVTLGAGVIHGRMLNRWGISEDMQAAAAQLARLPAQFGQWRSAADQELDATSVEMLECAAYKARTYVHEGTGQAVSVTVLLGRAGPITAHTPEICYSGRAYRVHQERQAIEIHDVRGGGDAFWALTFQANDVSGTLLRVCYGWSAGARWSAPRDARFAFAGRPYVYKIQLSTPLSSLAAPQQEDPCRKFLEEFVPAARKYLIDPTAG